MTTKTFKQQIIASYVGAKIAIWDHKQYTVNELIEEALNEAQLVLDELEANYPELSPREPIEIPMIDLTKEKRIKEKSAAYQMGLLKAEIDAHDLNSVISNPYSKESQEYRDWDKGYNDKLDYLLSPK